MSNRNYYVICDDGCKFLSMTKDETIAAITEEMQGHVPAHIPLKASKIKEINRGNAIQFWFGTEAQYNALQSKSDNVIYMIQEHFNRRATDITPKMTSVQNTQRTQQNNIISIISGAEFYKEEYANIDNQLKGMSENVSANQSAIINDNAIMLEQIGKVTNITRLWSTTDRSQTSSTGNMEDIRRFQELWFRYRLDYESSQFTNNSSFIKIPTSAFLPIGDNIYVNGYYYDNGFKPFKLSMYAASNNIIRFNYITGLYVTKIFEVYGVRKQFII